MAKISIRESISILALANDSGPCGCILRRVEGRVLLKAARREDTWDFLLGLNGLAHDVRQFCRAAQSVEYGLHRLARMAVGLATPRTDWVVQYQGAIRTHNDKSAERLVRTRILPALEKAKAGSLETAAAELPLDLRDLLRQEMSRIRHKLARRLGRRKAEELFAHGLTAEDRLAWVFQVYPRETRLITGWLRLGYGDPGLCFLSKTALAHLWHFLGFKMRDCLDPKDEPRKRLHRLGLVQGPIWVTAASQTETGGPIVLTFAGGEKRLLRTALKTGDLWRYKGYQPPQS